jgi:hypothetical protein
MYRLIDIQFFLSAHPAAVVGRVQHFPDGNCSVYCRTRLCCTHFGWSVLLVFQILLGEIQEDFMLDRWM